MIWFNHVVGAFLGDKGWKRSSSHRGGELCPGDLDRWGPWQRGQTCAKAGHSGQYQGDTENLSPHINYRYQYPLGAHWNIRPHWKSLTSPILLLSSGTYCRLIMIILITAHVWSKISDWLHSFSPFPQGFYELFVCWLFRHVH